MRNAAAPDSETGRAPCLNPGGPTVPNRVAVVSSTVPSAPHGAS